MLCAGITALAEEGVVAYVDVKGLEEGYYILSPKVDEDSYEGMTFLSEAASVTLTAIDDGELAAFCKLVAHAGTVEPLPEHLMDAGSALFGCGPAFVDLFIEALADGGVACGLPRKTAFRFAAQTVEGAGKTARISGQHPGALKDVVCSPAGSTIQGVRALEKGGFRSAAMEAVIAAYERNLELKKGE